MLSKICCCVHCQQCCPTLDTTPDTCLIIVVHIKVLYCVHRRLPRRAIMEHPSDLNHKALVLGEHGLLWIHNATHRGSMWPRLQTPDTTLLKHLMDLHTEVVKMLVPVHVAPVLGDCHEEGVRSGLRGRTDGPRGLLGSPLEGQAHCVGVCQPHWVDQHALCNKFPHIAHDSHSEHQPKLGLQSSLKRSGLNMAWGSASSYCWAFPSDHHSPPALTP